MKNYWYLCITTAAVVAVAALSCTHSFSLGGGGGGACGGLDLDRTKLCSTPSSISCRGCRRQSHPFLCDQTNNKKASAIVLAAATAAAAANENVADTPPSVLASAHQDHRRADYLMSKTVKELRTIIDFERYKQIMDSSSEVIKVEIHKGDPFRKEFYDYDDEEYSMTMEEDSSFNILDQNAESKKDDDATATRSSAYESTSYFRPSSRNHNPKVKELGKAKQLKKKELVDYIMDPNNNIDESSWEPPPFREHWHRCAGVYAAAQSAYREELQSKKVKELETIRNDLSIASSSGSSRNRNRKRKADLVAYIVEQVENRYRFGSYLYDQDDTKENSWTDFQKEAYCNDLQSKHTVKELKGIVAILLSLETSSSAASNNNRRKKADLAAEIVKYVEKKYTYADVCAMIGTDTDTDNHNHDLLQTLQDDFQKMQDNLQMLQNEKKAKETARRQELSSNMTKAELKSFVTEWYKGRGATSVKIAPALRKAEIVDFIVQRRIIDEKDNDVEENQPQDNNINNLLGIPKEFFHAWRRRLQKK